MFVILVCLVAVLAGSVASVAGFGIGSLLTPVVASQLGMKTAVAAVAIPHFIATAVRFWRLREYLDRQVFFTFGLVNAAGSLAGALLHSVVASPILTWVLAALLIFAGAGGLLGYSERMRLGRRFAYVAGAVSGLFGGLVGNQGGIRAAALLSLNVEREAFVATATAIGLAVDLARLPVYISTDGERMLSAWELVICTTAAVIGGTLAGEPLLRRIPRPVFRRVVSALLIASAALLVLAPNAGS